jgi:hypothetical protein
MDKAFSLPIRELGRREHVSPTKLYRLADEGKIDTFLEGGRRRIIVASWERYLLGLMAEQSGGRTKLSSSNPKVRAREAAAATPPPTPARRKRKAPAAANGSSRRAAAE